MTCPHDFVERETAVTADGMCPLCLAAEIRRLEATLKIGPTGEFPDGGPLDSTDKGAINVMLRTVGGKVRIDFGTKLAWVALPPKEAITFAEAILAKARGLRQ